MKRIIYILIVLCLSQIARADYFLLGVKADASANDKQLVKSIIRNKIDPNFSVDNCVVYRRKANHAIRFYVANWDMRRGFKFTVAQANTWLDNHAGEFDNRNNIAVTDKIPSTWEVVPKEE